MNRLSGPASGFLLIEFVVYLTLVSCIIGLALQYALNGYVHLRVHTEHTQILTELASAQDLLFHDLIRAPMSKKQWKVITPTTIIWHANKTDYGWSLESSNLVRRQGKFNTDEQTWDSSTGSVVAADVKNFVCVSIAYPHDNEKLIGMSWAIETTKRDTHNIQQGIVRFQERIIDE